MPPRELFPFCEDLTDLHDHALLSRRLEAAIDMQDSAVRLAASLPLREELADNAEYWDGLRRSWHSLEERWDPETGKGYSEYLLAQTRLTRNAVAEVQRNQEHAFACEPSIRGILLKLTTHAWISNPTYYPLTRALTQALSNLITSNDPLSGRLWEDYMSLPDEQNVLIRLLSIPDPRTISSTLVLVLNCTSSDPSRAALLASSLSGRRTAVSLLDRISELFEASDDEGSEEGRAFDLGYTIFCNLFRADMFGPLYRSLALPDTPLSPTQLTLLKLYDSYIDALPSSFASPSISPLVPELLALAAHIRHINDCTPDPHVCLGLVLVAGCLNGALLKEETPGVGCEIRTALETDKGEDGMGVVESLIDLLRRLQTLQPPVNPLTKPPVDPSSSSDSASQPPDRPPEGLAYIKRDVVRLLSTLAHRSKKVQDRVRDAGGIQIILGLSGLDEMNPYLREHALFAIRNLLENNPESQAVVEGLELQGVVDEEGVMKNLKLQQRKAGSNLNLIGGNKNMHC